MNCKKYQILIEKYISSEIKDTELAELKAHTQKCASCCNRFEQVDKIESTIKDALSSATTIEQASDSILSKLRARRVARAPIVLFSKQMAVAASIFLAVGLLSGFGLAGFISAERIAVPPAEKVPMKVAQLEGIVLVRHQDSDLWRQLQPGSNIYLGDTFHSTAESTFVLELEDKSTLELNQNSMLVLKLYNGGTQFHLEHGKLAAALESPHPPFFVSTPHGRVEALGTEFTVTVE